ncbi:tRNA guanosine(34) transglycosylase Tgt [Alienimonas californiensis]|uniref:Queuine tRNA-ribosyltransferase n=1 Tax=Alienimonas californiensis TaxID=2527989 RepID=A0A517PDQ5_9PLAN|nr:tRNA guanosine(34) transglycosylase Tgt [Alienimonas californiensis]QDT17518.1 Queuine tRNA-ribosyltransferase [Alienimonas californiensis]
MSDPFAFDLAATDGAARAGTWSTPHGAVPTPAFMPVGTAGSVKGVMPEQLAAIGSTQILANTYHLALRPGADVVAELGGLHRMMAWDGPILTDSGGFQVFSLAALATMTEEGVRFTSHIDGAKMDLTPEDSVDVQAQLGADVMMCLDECPPLPCEPERMQAAVDRTTRWAQRCRDQWDARDRRTAGGDPQALFGIVQGGVDPAMRERSARGLLPLEFPGYAIGGLSVGEAPSEMYRTLEATTPFLPVEKPRYLMGVGTPTDLLHAVMRGVDLFDCVMPTRNGRNGSVFTSAGTLKIKNAAHARDDSPIDLSCDCPACKRGGPGSFSRGTLRHLFLAGEMLAPILLSLHNLRFYHRLLAELRAAIVRGEARAFVAAELAKWGGGANVAAVNPPPGDPTAVPIRP